MRGKKVMLDRDLAVLYGVETRVLNQAVKRNEERFPDDFMFRLSLEEMKNWISQIVISNQKKMGIRKRPYVFTQEGVAMLSSVLNSKRAIHVNIQIMRAFVRIRELIANHKDLQKRIDELEKKLTKKMEDKFGIYEEQFKIVFEAFEEIKLLLNPHLEKPRRRIGFHNQ